MKVQYFTFKIYDAKLIGSVFKLQLCLKNITILFQEHDDNIQRQEIKRDWYVNDNQHGLKHCKKRQMMGDSICYKMYHEI